MRSKAEEGIFNGSSELHNLDYESPKYKNPRCSTISNIIGATQIEHALLDLGASVNLLPCYVYKQWDWES